MSAVASPSTAAAMAISGVWYSEVAYGQWIPGDATSSRRLHLPAGTTPIASGAGLVVVADRTASSTKIGVWEPATGLQAASAVVPFNVTGAAVSPDGSEVYLAGVTGGQPVSDAGLSSLSIRSGKVRQLVDPAPLAKAWQGNAAREVAVSTDGSDLATALCGAPAGSAESSCELSVVDPSSGALMGRVSTAALYLAAVGPSALITRNQQSVVAFDFAGSELWRFDAAEIRGPVAAAAGRVLVAYAPAGTTGPTRVAALADGAARDLLTATGDAELTIWPRLSDARTFVVADGPAMEAAFGSASVLSASAIDAATGAVSRDSISITSGGMP